MPLGPEVVPGGIFSWAGVSWPLHIDSGVFKSYVFLKEQACWAVSLHTGSAEAGTPLHLCSPDPDQGGEMEGGDQF